ncbi:MAG: hypothetical protein K8T10_17815 [Candidatus Eremiobacteraeota bacterium]|nr:hypothetical protein [Candidatus Eremiobacteraeota bacterium]
MAKILIFGAGAVGQFIGSLISLAGHHKVTMVGRYDHYDTIKLHGLKLRRHGKVKYLKNLEFLPSLDRIPRNEVFDWIFMTVKSYKLSSSLKDLSFFINNKVKFLLFQMGIGSHDNVAKVIPKERIFLASLTANCAIIEPGTVVETNKGGALCLAPLVLRNDIDDLRSIFTGVDIEILTFEDWKVMKWSALLYEILLNGLCALGDYKPDKVAGQRQMLEIEIEAFQEAVKVVKAIGVDVIDLPAYPIKKLIFYLKFPGILQGFLFRNTLMKKDSTTVSTLKNDMEKGRKGTEIGFINGAVSHWGKERKIRTPVNDFLTDELVKIVTGKKLWEIYRKKYGEIYGCLKIFKLNYIR